MGLDLIMYNKREYMEYNGAEYDKITELAYGRKTWAIESYFAARSYPIIQEVCLFDVPKEAWDEFYATAINLGFEKFKIWIDVISEYEPIGEHMGENTDDEEDYQLEEIYMKAYTKTEEYMSHLFGSAANYQLGMAWEAKAVVNWVESYPKVKETYERGDGVIMVASF